MTQTEKKKIDARLSKWRNAFNVRKTGEIDDHGMQSVTIYYSLYKRRVVIVDNECDVIYEKPFINLRSISLFLKSREYIVGEIQCIDSHKEANEIITRNLDLHIPLHNVDINGLPIKTNKEWDKLFLSWKDKFNNRICIRYNEYKHCTVYYNISESRIWAEDSEGVLIYEKPYISMKSVSMFLGVAGEEKYYIDDIKRTDPDFVQIPIYTKEEKPVEKEKYVRVEEKPVKKEKVLRWKGFKEQDEIERKDKEDWFQQQIEKRGYTKAGEFREEYMRNKWREDGKDEWMSFALYRFLNDSKDFRKFLQNEGYNPQEKRIGNVMIKGSIDDIIALFKRIKEI